MIKVVCLCIYLLVCNGVAGAASLSDVWSNQYLYDNGGGAMWRAPGNAVTGAAVSRGALVTTGSGGLQVMESGLVRLGDSRSVTLAASRFVPVGELLAGVGRLASGPYGLAAAIALPFFVEWVAGDHAQHIRINNGALEQIDPKLCLSSCIYYGIDQIPNQFLDQAGVCDLLNGWYAADGGVKWVSTGGVYGSCVGKTSYLGAWPVISKGSRTPDAADWLPASMDDIAPYMTPRVPAVSAIAALTSLGVDLASTPVSVTGPSPALAPLDPYVQRTDYPAPSPIVSTSVVPGNPFGLAPSSPTVTGSGTSSTTLSPGSTSATGPVPLSNPPAPGPVPAPQTTTTTSTYNPTTNQTTSETRTVTDSQTVTQTTTTVTNITNTTNTSNVTNDTTTTTVITNNTTNQQIVKTDTKAQVSPDPKLTDCEKNPSIIGCSEFGTPENPTLPKSSIPFVFTPKVFGGGASCPAPLSFSVRGASYSVGFQPICDQLVYLKALMLMLAGVMAAYILADSFKVS